MRVLLMAAASLAALSALPAAAQSYSPSYDGGYSRMAVPRPWQVRAMIDAAERRGELSDEQATNMREEADELARLDRRAQRDGDGDVRRDLNRRTFALLRELREARSGSGADYAYRGRPTEYPPAYRTPQGDDDHGRPAPGSDDDERYAAPSGSDDAYRGGPPSYDSNRASPETYDRYRSAPSADDPDRAAPSSNDEPNYDDPDGQDDGMTPSDDGIYRPRAN